VPHGCSSPVISNASLRGRFRAVWAFPPAVFFSVAHSVFCLPRICGATRLSLAGYLFLFFYFIF
jgi:hypothetical protein